MALAEKKRWTEAPIITYNTKALLIPVSDRRASLTGKATVLKTVGLNRPWGFESLALRQFQLISTFGEVAELAEGDGLLNRCTGLNLYRGFESLPLRQN